MHKSEIYYIQIGNFQSDNTYKFRARRANYQLISE